MPTRTNKERAHKARTALKPYADGDDFKSPVVDLLSDLRHYCDVQCLDFGDLDRIAYNHYVEEIGEERHAKK